MMCDEKKLEPKPNPEGELRGWSDLNRSLQRSFKSPSKSKRFTFILLNYYEMEKEEIIEELEKNGYTVTDLDDKLYVE